MNLEAKIIDPNKRKSRVRCSACELSYSARNYKILYENEKLAFFKMKLPNQRMKIYCHDCLYKAIHGQMAFLNKINLEMKLLDHTVNLIFSKD